MWSLTQNVYPEPLFQENSILEAPDYEAAGIIPGNRYYQGDNLAILRTWSDLQPNLPIKLIYIDPPYMSQTRYYSLKDNSQPPAFEDRWRPENYLDMLYPRLRLMREVLDDAGSIFVHVDWHVSHYVHLLLDEIFGAENFINEIAWCYSGGSNSRRHLQRKHDLIYWYGRSSAYTFNPQHRPYTSGTMTRGLTASKGDKYRLAAEGARLQDWWTDINKILSPTARENYKYPTQKPRLLLDRIIRMASNPGDLVADFFSGSGTTAEVCNQLGRPWILCDSSLLALQTAVSRLTRNDSPPFSIFAPLQEQRLASGQLTLKAPIMQIKDDGHVWVSLGIAKYRPAQPAPEPAVDDTSSLIEFWEIDPDYDGTAFNSRCQLFRSRKGELPLNVLLSLPRRGSYKIAVQVHDIFAGRQTQVLEFQ
ncbi:MAG TPA: site-specific DNA-methyltransferase [Syntrophomonas sp.]|nr:site-specific DNA-methyltransferase [Syntrophomonas sp.]